MKQGTALIVGAGIGGLAAGIALQRAGWQVRIFELRRAHVSLVSHSISSLVRWRPCVMIQRLRAVVLRIMPAKLVLSAFQGGI